MSIKVTSSILFWCLQLYSFLYFRNSCQPCGSEKKMAWSKFRPPFISLRDAESAFRLISLPCLLAGFDRVCQCLSLASHCVCVSIRLYLCVYVSVYPGVSVCPCIYLCVSMCPLCALPQGRGQRKKNVFFRAFPKFPNPPPHDPNSGNFVLFFYVKNDVLRV